MIEKIVSAGLLKEELSREIVQSWCLLYPNDIKFAKKMVVSSVFHRKRNVYALRGNRKYPNTKFESVISNQISDE